MIDKEREWKLTGMGHGYTSDGKFFCWNTYKRSDGKEAFYNNTIGYSDPELEEAMRKDGENNDVSIGSRIMFTLLRLALGLCKYIRAFPSR
jgi:hypothetical protein